MEQMIRSPITDSHLQRSLLSKTLKSQESDMKGKKSFNPFN